MRTYTSGGKKHVEGAIGRPLSRQTKLAMRRLWLDGVGPTVPPRTVVVCETGARFGRSFDNAVAAVDYMRQATKDDNIGRELWGADASGPFLLGRAMAPALDNRDAIDK